MADCAVAAPRKRLRRNPAKSTGRAAGQDREGRRDTEHLTDVGNARRLVAWHGQDLRFVHPWGAWLCWNGRHWCQDGTGEAMRRAKDTVRRLYQEALAEVAEAQKALAAAPDEHDRREHLEWSLGQAWALVRHALRSEQVPRLKAMLEAARSEPGIPLAPDQLDADPWALNARNGTIDLKTGRLREHRREDLLSRAAAVRFDPAARCPRWERFVLEIMDGNPDLAEYLRRVVGYALTGDVREQCLFVLHGDGANGKSTLLDTLLALLGPYGGSATPELLLARSMEAHPAERAELFGRRLVACVEVQEGRRLAEPLVKQLTGGDRIIARRMRENFWEFTPTHKLFLAANHKPVIRGSDHGIWRRIKLVPFGVTFEGDRKDAGLKDALRAELPGILTWAVRACLAWQRDGLGEPDEVRQATGDYRAGEDLLGRWLEECCILGSEYRGRAAALYGSYRAWCEHGGERPATQKAFGDSMTARGFERLRSGGIWYLGVAVRGDGPGEAPE